MPSDTGDGGFVRKCEGCGCPLAVGHRFCSDLCADEAGASDLPAHRTANDVAAAPTIRQAGHVLRVNRCGTPVGYQPIHADHDEPPCAEGCLAPGSSPHRHNVTVGWHLIGTTGTVDTDLHLEPTNVRIIRPFTDTKEVTHP